MKSVVRLSVVIPTFNNLPILRQCVERWQQFGPAAPVAFELLIIEDGCRDGTPAYLNEIAGTEWGRQHLRWFHEDDAHELVCTNRGLIEARGSLIIAWQDDMLLNASWFMPELLRTFDMYQELGLLSLSRGLDCLPLKEPIEQWEDLHDPRRLRSTIGPRLLNWLRLQEVDIVIRPWAVRRACIEKVGCLDDNFRPTEWDEADLCFRIRQAGWKIATHSYERLGAYVHLGSTTLNFSDQYKQKVLRNGQLFHQRWSDPIDAFHHRVRHAWFRCATILGWLQTLIRIINATLRGLLSYK
jgi:hypothetical protein